MTGFVDSAFPAIVIALNGLIEQVKTEVLKRATAVVGDVGKKVEAVCSKSCLPWMSALFAKASEKPSDPVATPAVVAAPVVATAPEVVAEPVAQTVEAAASSDIVAALASVSEEAPVAKEE